MVPRARGDSGKLAAMAAAGWLRLGNIQQAGTGGGSHSICYGLYHLVDSRSILGLDVTICQTFESLPSEKFGTHSIILDISPTVKQQRVSPQSVGGLVSVLRTGLKRG